MTSLLYHVPSTGNPPSQEPIPGNLHPHPLYSTESPDGLPKVNRWARLTGPRLDLTRRAVLQAIARHSDEQGECRPTQEQLAEELDCTTRTVRNSVRDLEALQLLTCWVLHTRHGTQNVYRLAGAACDWEPEPKNPRESAPISAAYRLVIQRQAQLLKLNGIPFPGQRNDIPPPRSSSIYPVTENKDMDYNHDTTTGHRNDVPPVPEESAAPVADPIAELARANWHRLCRSWKKGLGEAIKWYRAHPGELEEQLENLDVEEAVRNRQDNELLLHRDPQDKEPGKPRIETRDPLAATIWTQVLESLRARLTRTIFDCNLAGTVGVADDGRTFTVEAPTAITAAYLYHRMHMGLRKELIKTTGRDVELEFQAAASQNPPELAEGVVPGTMGISARELTMTAD